LKIQYYYKNNNNNNMTTWKKTMRSRFPSNNNGWLLLFVSSLVIVLQSSTSCQADNRSTTSEVAIHPRKRGQQQIIMQRQKDISNEHSRIQKNLSGGSAQKIWEGFQHSDHHPADGASSDHNIMGGNKRRNLRSRHEPRESSTSSSSNRGLQTSSESESRITRSRNQRNNKPRRPPPFDSSIWPQHDDEDVVDGEKTDALRDDVECYQRRVITFLQLSALENSNNSDGGPVNPVFINYNIPDAQNLGTVYIYNDALFEDRSSSAAAELEGSFATGHCVRTQMRESMGDGSFVSGGGYCHFTYTLFDGRTSYTFNAVGEVFDSFGGKLVITGGTESLVGVTGDVVLEPLQVSEDGSRLPSSEDVFLEADVYQSTASLYINMCL
jgi:hypothetical protein